MSAQARQHTGRFASRCLAARMTPSSISSSSSRSSRSSVTAHPAALPPQAGASQRRALAGIPAGALAGASAGAPAEIALDPASSGASTSAHPLERSHHDAIRRAASRATAGSASLGSSSSRPHRLQHATTRLTLLSSTSPPPPLAAAASRQRQQQRARFSHSLSPAAKPSNQAAPTCCYHASGPFPAPRHIASKPHLTLTGCDSSSLLLFRVSPSPRHLRKQLIAVMGSAAQTRDHGGHGGHSHSHSHAHHDNSFLMSANTSDPGVRITRIGLLSNLLMAIAKFIGGWTFGSKAMVADAWHSITDLASDVLTLATVSWSIKPPTDKFPLGFGKVESLGSLGVSGMLVVGGFYMGWESAISLFGHVNPEMAHTITEHVGHGHGHSHSHSAADLGIPSLHAAWLAGATILIKEWLYHATIKVARERKSSVLASNAIHHRVDSLTGIVTLAAIIGANVVENAAWLDPVGGLLISLMVIKAGVDNTKMALYELADVSVDDEVKSAIRKQTQRAIANVADGHVAELRDVSGIKSGQNYLIDLELAVPGSWTVESFRELEDAVRAQVGAKVRGVRRVRVRFVSQDAPVNEKFDEFVQSTVNADPADESEQEENGQANGGANGHNHKH